MVLRNKKNIISALIISSVILYINVNAQQEIPEPAEDLLFAGIKTVEEAKAPSDIDIALMMFIEVNRTTPELPEVHYYLGKTLTMLQGNTLNAINELKKYIELYPDAPDRGIVEWDIKQLEEGLKSKRKSSLMGVVLMSLNDGVYISNLNESIHPVSLRYQSLQKGDKILMVNEENISGLTLQQVLDKIDSVSSEKIKLTIIRVDKPIEVFVDKKLKDNLQSFKLKQLGEDDLDAIVESSEFPVVVLWSNYSCKACKDYYSSFVNLQNKYNEKIIVLEVDLEENKLLDYQHNVDRNELPVITIYEDGDQVKKIIGYDEEILNEKIDDLVNN